ncbi:hypothetical protein GO730_32475 [Spirosoma sp. HMF3257]|uniref:Tetratricopeptide repeat protein n=1 Tax=Spirosoma telluris TaxID=2183553 RepID=A0A327NSF2_9BACT|nr:hypothetical protein [Spirosoma telluris]RAI77665.1 hypothetical protein HMF3257_32375 [Spirosoma telluris]
MKLTEQQYELIEAYFNNDLSDTDRASFEGEFERDTDLKAEIQTQRELRLGLKALALDQRLKKAQQRWQQSNLSNHQIIQPQKDAEPTGKQILFGRQANTQRLGGFQYWVAAAVLIVVSGVGIWLYQQNSASATLETAYMEAYQPDDTQFLTKDFPTDLPANDRTKLLDIMQGYKAGNYASVIHQLETLPTEKQTLPYKNYFLGLSLLANKQADKAIPYLHLALTNSSGALAQKSTWFLALAYLKTGNKAEANQRLQTIAADPNQPFNGLARQVLARVKW